MGHWQVGIITVAHAGPHSTIAMAITVSELQFPFLMGKKAGFKEVGDWFKVPRP